MRIAVVVLAVLFATSAAHAANFFQSPLARKASPTTI
jgi:hypothetical protein